MNKKTFVKKAQKIHDNKYDYKLVQCVNYKIKIAIICKKHKLVFRQSLRAHLSGQGCWKCAGRRYRQHIPLTTEIFIKRSRRIHGNKYSYNKTKYINSRTRVKIFCKKHKKIFFQMPSAHLGGKGCLLCGRERSTASFVNKKEFIKKANKIHKKNYDYTNCIYNSYKTKLKICCKRCSKKDHKKWFFYQTPNSHLQGHGCPRCGNCRNELERTWLTSLGLPDDIYHRQVRLEMFPHKFIVVDGFNPRSKTVYEFYGDYFHGNPKKYSANDYNKLCKKTFGKLYFETKKKEKLIRKAGYSLITMWEDEFEKYFNNKSK